ncbi:MAG: FtsQ-type POTRA domain-containing protein [Bdellovibrionota bacterium]
MKHLRPILIFTLAFVVTAGALAAFFDQAGLFHVKTIPVEVSGISATRDVPGPQGLKRRAEKAIARFKARKIWDVDLSAMKSSLARDEWVKDVTISRSLPNGVKVKIEPKSAALILVGAKGELMPIAEDGARLAALPADAIPDVPLLRGEIFGNDEAKRKQAIAFVNELPVNGFISRRNVSELVWSKDDGYSVMLMQPKVEVKFGEDALQMKVLRVTQVLNYMSAHELKGRVIDASFSKKVLVRLRKGP